MDGRYIGADYLAVRILVGEIDGPSPPSSTYIDYFLYYISAGGVVRAGDEFPTTWMSLVRGARKSLPPRVRVCA